MQASQIGLISVSSSTHIEHLLKKKWHEEPKSYKIKKKLTNKQEEKLRRILKTKYSFRN